MTGKTIINIPEVLLFYFTLTFGNFQSLYSKQCICGAGDQHDQYTATTYCHYLAVVWLDC